MVQQRDKGIACGLRRIASVIFLVLNNALQLGLPYWQREGIGFAARARLAVKVSFPNWQREGISQADV